MAKIKKTVEKPPIWLERKLIALSESKIWSEAIKEWELKNYYYVTVHKLCPCSPGDINYLCLLINRFNSSELEICNPCAELYLGISEGSRLESAIRRIRGNNKAKMGLDALDYLMKRGVVNFVEHNNYWVAMPFGDDDDYLEYEIEINKRLINFTDYKNKDAFDKINLILAWANDNKEWSIDYLSTLKINLLHIGVADMKYLDDVIKKENIDEKRYGYKEQKAGMQLLWKYFNARSTKHILPPRYTKKRISEYEKIAIENQDIQNNIRFSEAKDLDQSVDDSWNKPIFQYMSEETLESIARVSWGWGRNIPTCGGSFHYFIYFLENEELLNIYRENPGIDKFRDYVELLSMRHISMMFNQLMSRTLNQRLEEAAMLELNSLFEKENIRVKYDGRYLRFLSIH